MEITITTPLYYVNDKPHLGSTYTTLACDTFARFHRLEGNKVNFVTGVDEHGQKIERTAKSSNLSPIDHCNIISSLYQELWIDWDITNDKFVRTTSIEHHQLVHEFFERVSKSGDIILGNQKGWYCVGCEEYKDEPQDADSPICPIHLKALEWRDEENLFFTLSKYQKQIEKLVDSPSFIQPSSRRNEIINFVAQGLRDFSISRKNVKWGIPVPGYEGHTFYVWFDALLGYISALKGKGLNESLSEVVKHGWPANVHVIGKDILRFHAVYWPAMLLSAGLDIPKKVFGHGFLTREGQKMGKSLGNVLDPKELLKQYGSDAIRWYLLSDIRFGNDGDFQTKRFKDLINNDLANTIGNLLNRTSSMSRKWFSGTSPEYINQDDFNTELQLLSEITIKESLLSYKDMDFNRVCEQILHLASESNGYLNKVQPWSLIKDPSKKNIVGFHLYNVLESCRIIGVLLLPIIPITSRNILAQLGYETIPTLWTSELLWGLLEQKKVLPKPFPIVPKIED